jgi:hypothetical protein
VVSHIHAHGCVFLHVVISPRQLRISSRSLPRFRFAAPEGPSQPTGIPVIVSLEHSTPFEGRAPQSTMEGQAPTLQPSPSRKKSKTAKLAKLNPMKWFKRKKSRTLEPIEVSKERSSLAPHGTPPVSSRLLAQLPGALLERIFSFVCPHAQDETYESCEQSAVEDTCMLCDLRDLAHCAQVSRQWGFHATNLL